MAVIEPGPYARLAFTAIEEYVRFGRVMDIPQETPEEMLSTCAGAFVCLKIDGDLRGCIGTIEPACKNLAEEIVCNAISAATRDPRFLPVETGELEFLKCSVDVLTPAEEIAGPENLDPKRYGVIVECGNARGLLLPDLDGVDTAEQQLTIARHKAGIPNRAPIKLYRFCVQRYE